MIITLKQQDIIPYVYFVSSMAQQSKNGMYQIFGSKRDFIGGIFDRFINIIPESVSFNQYFIPKAQQQLGDNRTVEVYSDFFMYNPQKVGIAPDVMGLKVANKIIPFVKYDDTKETKQYWVNQQGCPQIEVKSFFGRKHMVSLRDQHYGDKFLVMVSANIDADYLLSFFNSEVFSQQHLNKLTMPDDFIISNSKGLLANTKSVEFNRESLGEIEILCVTTATDFEKIALKLNGGDIPRYFVGREPRKKPINESAYKYNLPLSHYCDRQQCGLYRFNNNWYQLFNGVNEKTLDIEVSNPDALTVINKTNNAITILAHQDTTVNGYAMHKGNQYNLNFGTMDKVAKEEYFMSKSLIGYLPNYEDKLINSLAEIIKNN